MPRAQETRGLRAHDDSGNDARAGASPKIAIVITRADGRVERIGVIEGGRWRERLMGRLRLMLANARARRRG